MLGLEVVIFMMSVLLFSSNSRCSPSLLCARLAVVLLLSLTSFVSTVVAVLVQGEYALFLSDQSFEIVVFVLLLYSGSRALPAVPTLC